MTDHPDRETLKRFIAGEQTSGEARRTDQHLSSCSDCRDRADEISTGQAFRLMDSWLSPNYDEAFDRAAERVVERLVRFQEAPESTETLFTELLREPVSGRRRRIDNDERFHSLQLCQLLQSNSRKAWASSPFESLEMADLAVEVSRYLDSGRYGSSIVEDARALAWSYLGNAFRIGSDFQRADQALYQAWSHHLLAGGDTYTETELLVFTASLRRDQGRYQEAVHLCDRAIALYREGQESHLEGAALILKGLTLGQAGRSQEAISLFRAALDRIDPQRDRRLVFAGTLNLFGFLAEAGWPGKAQELIQQNRHLYQDLGRMDLAQARWLEGRIAYELGRFPEATTVLNGVRESFLDLQAGAEYFFASLDLARIYSLNGRKSQAKEVLKELIPLGEGLGLSKGVLVARLLYEKA